MLEFQYLPDMENKEEASSWQKYFGEMFLNPEIFWDIIKWILELDSRCKLKCENFQELFEKLLHKNQQAIYTWIRQ